MCVKMFHRTVVQGKRTSRGFCVEESSTFINLCRSSHGICKVSFLLQKEVKLTRGASFVKGKANSTESCYYSEGRARPSSTMLSGCHFEVFGSINGFRSFAGDIIVKKCWTRTTD